MPNYNPINATRNLTQMKKCNTKKQTKLRFVYLDSVARSCREHNVKRYSTRYISNNVVTKITNDALTYNTIMHRFIKQVFLANPKENF